MATQIKLNTPDALSQTKAAALRASLEKNIKPTDKADFQQLFGGLFSASGDSTSVERTAEKSAERPTTPNGCDWTQSMGVQNIMGLRPEHSNNTIKDSTSNSHTDGVSRRDNSRSEDSMQGNKDASASKVNQPNNDNASTPTSQKANQDTSQAESGTDGQTTVTANDTASKTGAASGDIPADAVQDASASLDTTIATTTDATLTASVGDAGKVSTQGKISLEGMTPVTATDKPLDVPTDAKAVALDTAGTTPDKAVTTPADTARPMIAAAAGVSAQADPAAGVVARGLQATDKPQPVTTDEPITLEAVREKAGVTNASLPSMGPATPGVASATAPTSIFTGTSTPIKVNSPLGSPTFPGEVSQKIVWMVGRNMTQADIRINPETLGPLNLKIQIKGNEAHLSLTAQDAQSQQLLTQAIPALKEILSQSGINAQTIQVRVAGDEQAAGFGFQNPSQGQSGNSSQPGQQGSSRSTGSLDALNSALPVETTASRASANRSANGGVDLFA